MELWREQGSGGAGREVDKGEEISTEILEEDKTEEPLEEEDDCEESLDDELRELLQFSLDIF